MNVRCKLACAALGLLAGGLWFGCSGALGVLNPDFVAMFPGAPKVATQPDEAPGLLVTVENRTSRAAQMVVSYRDSGGDVEGFTTVLQSGDKSAQMLICPVDEITLGSVSNLDAVGARVALVEGFVDPQTPGTVPFIDVEPFGVLLRDTINYDCGDAIDFVVWPSSANPSGYQTIAFIRRSTVTP